MAWVLQFRRRPTAKRINTTHGQRELSKVHALVAPTKYGQSKQSCSQQAQFFYCVWLGCQTENPILCVLCLSSFLTILAFLVSNWKCVMMWKIKTKIPEEKGAKAGKPKRVRLRTSTVSIIVRELKWLRTRAVVSAIVINTFMTAAAVVIFAFIDIWRSNNM